MVEYRYFRKHLRQRPGKIGKLGGYGPQGDQTFRATDQADDDFELLVFWVYCKLFVDTSAVRHLYRDTSDGRKIVQF